MFIFEYFIAFRIVLGVEVRRSSGGSLKREGHKSLE